MTKNPRDIHLMRAQGGSSMLSKHQFNETCEIPISSNMPNRIVAIVRPSLAVEFLRKNERSESYVERERRQEERDKV